MQVHQLNPRKDSEPALSMAGRDLPGRQWILTLELPTMGSARKAQEFPAGDGVEELPSSLPLLQSGTAQHRSLLWCEPCTERAQLRTEPAWPRGGTGV